MGDEPIIARTRRSKPRADQQRSCRINVSSHEVTPAATPRFQLRDARSSRSWASGRAVVAEAVAAGFAPPPLVGDPPRFLRPRIESITASSAIEGVIVVERQRTRHKTVDGESDATSRVRRRLVCGGRTVDLRDERRLPAQVSGWCGWFWGVRGGRWGWFWSACGSGSQDGAATQPGTPTTVPTLLQPDPDTAPGTTATTSTTAPPPTSSEAVKQTDVDETAATTGCQTGPVAGLRLDDDASVFGVAIF